MPTDKSVISHKKTVMGFFKLYSINIRGELYKVTRPLVMGILNVTPDSFYSNSRCQGEEAVRTRLHQILEEGADIIDIGGYSSRPNADEVTAEEEYNRLAFGLKIIREEAPQAIVSVDSFRADVIRRCHENYGIEIVNDIAAGELDEKMFATVAELKLPYIMMHMRGNPHNMMQQTDYEDITADVLQYFGEKISAATYDGINDIIVDPGFGFSKTIDQNYELLKNLEAFKYLDKPLLVGVSRKSMIYKLLDTTPQESLNGTTVIDTVAILKGASIIRVHDVKAAMESVKIIEKLNA